MVFALTVSDGMAGGYCGYSKYGHGSGHETEYSLALVAACYLLFKLFEELYLALVFAFNECHNESKIRFYMFIIQHVNRINRSSVLQNYTLWQRIVKKYNYLYGKIYQKSIPILNNQL